MAKQNYLTDIQQEDVLAKCYNDTMPRIRLNRKIQATRCEYGMMHIENEYSYWEQRLMDLEVIMYNLEYKRIPEVAERLRKSYSVFIQLYDNMMGSLNAAISESMSNRDYLKILNKPCEDLYNVNTLNDIITALQDMCIFEKAISIYTDSPYYNESSHFDILYRYLSNQIIYLCRKTIDTTTVFTEDVEYLHNLINECLKCCNDFVAQYEKVVQVYNDSEQNKPLVIKTKIIEIFISRCNDLRNVLKEKQKFKSSNIPRYDIQEPNFSYPHTTYSENNIENIFDSIILKLKEPIKKIFDVEDSDWSYHYQTFQDELQELYIETETEINMALGYACNEMDYINTLLYLHNIYNSLPPKHYFKNKTNELYTNITNGIQSLIEDLHYKEEHEIYFKTPKYSGICMLRTIQYNKRIILKNELLNTLWMPSTSTTERFWNKYDSYVRINNQLFISVYKKWFKQIDPKIENQFNKIVLIEKQIENHYFTFSINLNNLIYDHIEESECWKLIRTTMPNNYQKFIYNSQLLKHLHRNIKTIIRNYNIYILTGLSKQEKLLFFLTIQTFIKLIKPFAKTYTWFQSNVVNKKIIKCHDVLESIQNIINVYKQCDKEICRICEQITKASLVISDVIGETDLKKKFNNRSNNTQVINIIMLYNEIIKYVTVVYEEFENHIEHMTGKLCWSNYIEMIDHRIYKSLCVSVQFSLEHIIQQREYQIIVIKVKFENSKITCTPSLKQLFPERSLLDMTRTLQFIPRLCQTFKLPNMDLPSYNDLIADNQTIDDLYTNINQYNEDSQITIKNYIKQFTLFRDIWTVNKQKYINAFKAEDHTAEMFDIKLTQYHNLRQKLEEANSLYKISYLHVIIDTQNISDHIIKHCNDWIIGFSHLLLDITDNLIQYCYTNITLNERRIMKLPKNLIEMVECIQLQKDMSLESDNWKTDVNLISQNVIVLEKHGIEMSQLMRDNYNKLMNYWDEHLSFLSKAEFMLKNKQEELKQMVLSKQITFVQETEQFYTIWKMFKTSKSSNDDLKSVDALDDLNNMRQKYNEIRTKEKQLKLDLELFNLKHVEPSQLFNIDEEMVFFNQVFTDINNWDTEWDIYKSTNFWTINEDIILIEVLNILELLNNYIQILKEENWKIIEIARDSVDDFRRVLILINDLKHPSMKIRQWDEVRKIMNKQFNEMDHSFTIGLITEMEIQKYEVQIREILNKAIMEMKIKI